MERSTTYLPAPARALKRRTGFLVIAVLTLASTATARDQWLTLRDGGQINGQPVDACGDTVLLASGQPVTGAVNVTAYHDDASGAIWPAGATLTWGTRETQYWTVHNDIPYGSSDLVVNVNATAPTTPGLYHLVVANSPQYHTGQVMSATSAAFGSSHPGTWYDGNDVGFDWTPAQFQEACDTGRVTTTFRHPTLDYPEGVQSATAVDLWVVGAPPDPYPTITKVSLVKPPESNATNAVILVHGWNNNPADVFETPGTPNPNDLLRTNMKANIETVLAGANLNAEWDVLTYDWSEDAKSWGWPSGEVKSDARVHGQHLADEIRGLGYTGHLHLISHSIGGRVIDEATRSLKDSGWQSPIHETFLDAYTPDNWEYDFGEMAEWADHYYHNDPVVLNTQDVFTHAYNLDVTWMTDFPDAGWSENHKWPLRYYDNTASSDVAVGGFQYSKESPFYEGWVHPESDGPETQIANLHAVSPQESLINRSETGAALVASDSMTMETGSEVWVNLLLTTEDVTNFLEFDFDFVSDSAGMLSVFLDGDQLAAFYEEFAFDGEQPSGKLFFEDLDEGAHVLAFRVDPLSDETSSVTISDIEAGYMYVVPEPSTAVMLLGVGMLVLSAILQRPRQRTNAAAVGSGT